MKIEARILEVILELKSKVIESGGRAEVLVVSPDAHRDYLRGATQLWGMRVEARTWMLAERAWVMSNEDLAEEDGAMEHLFGG
jgi:hypothetical protein